MLSRRLTKAASLDSMGTGASTCLGIMREVKKALRGVKVEVNHKGNVRRKYRVSGLTTQPTRELIFPLDEHMNMKSVVDYFQEMYGYTIRYAHLPCLQVGNEKKVNYLPMEACKIVEGQIYTKGLNEKQITSLLKVSCQRPHEQELDILQTVQQNDYDHDPYAKEFGINISSKLASIEARALPAPWVMLKSLFSHFPPSVQSLSILYMIYSIQLLTI
ncbi:hypothetical protein GQ457_06G017730 [Hibiscus cannabinus]